MITPIHPPASAALPTLIAHARLLTRHARRQGRYDLMRRARHIAITLDALTGENPQYLDAEICDCNYPISDDGDIYHVAGEPVDMICLASPMSFDPIVAAAFARAAYPLLREIENDLWSKPADRPHLEEIVEQLGALGITILPWQRHVLARYFA